MAKNELDDYSATAGSNTDVGGINIAENCSPANINNAIREVMSDIARVRDGTTTITNWYTASLNVSGTATIGTLSVTTLSPTSLAVSANATIGGTLGVTGAITGSSTLVATAITGDRFIPAASTVPANGMYLPAANTPAFASNSTERLRFNSSGAWGIAGANYGTSGYVLTSGGSGAAPSWTEVSSYDPTGTASTSGKIVLPINGGAASIMIQWGQDSCNGVSPTTVTFGTAFASTPRVTVSYTGSSPNNNFANTEDITAASFNGLVYDAGGSAAAGLFDWIAIGVA